MFSCSPPLPPSQGTATSGVIEIDNVSADSYWLRVSKGQLGMPLSRSAARQHQLLTHNPLPCPGNDWARAQPREHHMKKISLVLFYIGILTSCTPETSPPA